MKLRILENERFTCAGCTNCCREPYVELLAADVRVLRSLAWPKADPLHAAAPTRRIGGSTFLARSADGACLFLDQASGRCRIHERFGYESKPLACRVFPFRLAPTFVGEVSVAVRFECPTVRRNQGRPHAEQQRPLEREARGLGLAGGFSERTRCLLSREQIAAVVDFLVTLAPAAGSDDRRAIFLACLGDWLAEQPVDQLSRESLGRAFPALRERAEALAVGAARRPDAMQRLAFRTLLALALRRDEDVLQGRVGRISRMLGTGAIGLGRGSFQGAGLLHPPGTLRAASLFGRRLPVAADAWALPWRVVSTRLMSLQFLGAAHGGRDFLEGLRSLALVYPLILAAARYRAANRAAAAVETQDTDYAVAVIDHSFGRLPLLNSTLARRLERWLVQADVVTRLLRAL